MVDIADVLICVMGRCTKQAVVANLSRTTLAMRFNFGDVVQLVNEEHTETSAQLAVFIWVVRFSIIYMQ